MDCDLPAPAAAEIPSLEKRLSAVGKLPSLEERLSALEEIDETGNATDAAEVLSMSSDDGE